jgi:diketogulonate reductase-like aldo/keto reductase
MEQLVQEGKVKLLGISNCYDLSVLKTLVSFAQIKPAVIQNRFYAATAYDRAIRAYCQDCGMVYQSFWTLSANPQVLNDSNLTSIATYQKRSPAQILFRYLIQNGIVPLTGTTSLTHMKEDLAIFEFELNADECGLIKALL